MGSHPVDKSVKSSVEATTNGNNISLVYKICRFIHLLQNIRKYNEKIETVVHHSSSSLTLLNKFNCLLNISY